MGGCVVQRFHYSLTVNKSGVTILKCMRTLYQLLTVIQCSPLDSNPDYSNFYLIQSFLKSLIGLIH